MNKAPKTEYMEDAFSGEGGVTFSGAIQAINDRFGTDWNKRDKLILERMLESLMQDKVLVEQARANSFDSFKNAGEKKAMDVLIDSMQRNDRKSTELLKSQVMRAFVFGMVLKETYGRARQI